MMINPVDVASATGKVISTPVSNPRGYRANPAKPKTMIEMMIQLEYWSYP